MEELYEKINLLKKQLDNTPCIKEIKYLYQKIKQDQVLVDLLEKYNYTHDERIKKQLLENDLIREYKHEEAKLNFLILEINQKLKQITKKDKCGL